MPEISRFFGIIVTMHFNDHDPPFPCALRFAAGEILDQRDAEMDGDVSPRVRGLVMEWLSQHQQELRDDWARARAQQPLVAIPPLE
jgi:hypothetical protein